MDKCDAPGQLGALLRKEALYSSHITNWQKQKAQGLLTAAGSPKRGRKTKPSIKASEYEQLERRCEALEKRLKQAEAIIEVQKKVSEIFGSALSQPLTSDVNS